jgi:predicted HicB family RNase H-like nuclease
MPPEMHKRLKLEGIERDISMNDQIIAAVEQYLSNCGSEKDAINDN